MKLKKLPFAISFALASFLVIGQASFADSSDQPNHQMGKMMNMMNAMNSPEGEKMMKACGNFMDSYSNEAAENKKLD